MKKRILSIFRNLPDFKGKRRIARKLFGKLLENEAMQQVDGKFGCKYLIPNIADNIGFEILINGVYELDTIQLLNEVIPKNGTLLDIGSNIGAIAIPLAKTRPDIHIMGVEAAPWVFEYLKKNILVNNITNIQILNNVIDQQDGLVVDFYIPAERFGKGSLGMVFTDSSIKIETRSIDSLVFRHDINMPDAIKVDVEGFEYFIFKGGVEVLSKENAPSIVFEFADWGETSARGLQSGSAQQLLTDLGYKIFRLEGKRKIEMQDILVKGSCNFLAVKIRDKVN